MSSVDHLRKRYEAAGQGHLFTFWDDLSDSERDALRAIDAGGEASLAKPIGPIASAPLQTVGEDDFLYRAIGRIQRMGFRHLGVTDARGEVIGALTGRSAHRPAQRAVGDEPTQRGRQRRLVVDRHDEALDAVVEEVMVVSVVVAVIQLARLCYTRASNSLYLGLWFV